MYLLHFAFLLISIASKCPVARTDLSFNGPLEELNMNESDWDADTSIFDQVENPNLPTEDDLFNLDDGSDLPLFAGNPSVCVDGYQPVSRMRARSGGYCDQHGEHPDGLVPGDDSSAREAALTQEEISQQNCPSDYYQGIFIIPVCSAHDTDLIRPSGPFDENGAPLVETGMQDVMWCTLSKPCFD